MQHARSEAGVMLARAAGTAIVASRIVLRIVETVRRIDI
jgi:hypothetical protein